MKIEFEDPLFGSAVRAIDEGNISELRQMLESNPELISQRADNPVDGYFQYPYLLWFIADNPIRNGKLPANIVDIASLLIDTASKYAQDSFQHQINYAAGLVETGRIPRESGVQIQLLNLLFENGVTPGDGHGALANGNFEAAKHIVEKSGKVTLAAAVCLFGVEEVKKLLVNASAEDKQIALMTACFYGKTEMISLLLESGADPSGYITRGFHTHASPLHQAVFSGSLDAVKLLVNAGANLNAVDKVYDGTPWGWAEYMQTETSDELEKKKYKEIEDYLAARLNN